MTVGPLHYPMSRKPDRSIIVPNTMCICTRKDVKILFAALPNYDFNLGSYWWNTLLLRVTSFYSLDFFYNVDDFSHPKAKKSLFTLIDVSDDKEYIDENDLTVLRTFLKIQAALFNDAVTFFIDNT